MVKQVVWHVSLNGRGRNDVEKTVSSVLEQSLTLHTGACVIDRSTPQEIVRIRAIVKDNDVIDAVYMIFIDILRQISCVS